MNFREEGFPPLLKSSAKRVSDTETDKKFK